MTSLRQRTLWRVVVLLIAGTSLLAYYNYRDSSHEIAEVTACIDEGLTESTTMPLQDTLEVMRVLETCLRQSGIYHHEAHVELS